MRFKMTVVVVAAVAVGAAMGWLAALSMAQVVVTYGLAVLLYVVFGVLRGHRADRGQPAASRDDVRYLALVSLALGVSAAIAGAATSWARPAPVEGSANAAGLVLIVALPVVFFVLGALPAAIGMATAELVARPRREAR